MPDAIFARPCLRVINFNYRYTEIPSPPLRITAGMVAYIYMNLLILEDIREGSGVIKFVRRNGEAATVAARAGASMLELCRDAGIDELDALCGGNCSCATCHIQLDAEGYALFPAPEDDEADLLDGCGHRTAHSRLACQLVLPNDGVEMVVIIAPEG